MMPISRCWVSAMSWATLRWVASAPARNSTIAIWTAWAWWADMS